MYLYTYLYKMYTMYMANYTVKDFRANVRKALNEAWAGEGVFIQRHEQIFELRSFNVADKPRGLSKPTKSVTQKKLVPKILEPILDNIEKGTNRAVNGLCKAHGTPLDDRGRCMQKGCKYAK